MANTVFSRLSLIIITIIFIIISIVIVLTGTVIDSSVHLFAVLRAIKLYEEKYGRF